MNTKQSNFANFSGLLMRTCWLILFVTLVTSVTVFSQGTKVSNAINNQINPVITTDGSGGSIVAWQDRRSGKNEIYAQRMNALGVPMWTTNGIEICTQDSNDNPVIVSDDNGGAIIAWLSYRGSSTADIYAQRVNSNGVVQWLLNGVPVVEVVFEQDTLAMISDGFGGAILTWQDYRSNTGFPDIYAQRINSIGEMIWTANGVSVCNQAASQRGPKLVSDGEGGAFITWYDHRAGDYDIYAQRISTIGAPMFTVNGVAVCTFATDQLKPDITTDGAGGIIVVWYDYRSTTDYNIYAQRMGPALAIVWAVDGVVMNNNVAFAQTDPKIVSDGMGGAIISWTDNRTGVAPGTADIYAQRVNSTGAVQWTATGVTICTAVGNQIKSQLVSDGNNGAYITWEDHRNDGNADIYVQRISSAAALNWSAEGFPVCTVENDQLNPMILSNGNEGAIVVWQDYRSGNNFDIYQTGFDISGIFETVFQITMIPSGFYNTVTGRLNMSDTITAYLRETTSPYALVDSAKAILDSVTFTAIFNFENADTGTYYIVIKHRNSLETWSKHGGEIYTSGESFGYDFTSSESKAFGNNLILVDGRWCIISGDVNQDGIINAIDRAMAWNERNATGYIPEDVNGDGIVNDADLMITWNNRNKSTHSPEISDMITRRINR